jgi:hypothetical protein
MNTHHCGIAFQYPPCRLHNHRSSLYLLLYLFFSCPSSALCELCEHCELSSIPWLRPTCYITSFVIIVSFIYSFISLFCLPILMPCNALIRPQRSCYGGILFCNPSTHILPKSIISINLEESRPPEGWRLGIVYNGHNVITEVDLVWRRMSFLGAAHGAAKLLMCSKQIPPYCQVLCGQKAPSCVGEYLRPESGAFFQMLNPENVLIWGC